MIVVDYPRYMTKNPPRSWNAPSWSRPAARGSS